MGNPYNKIIGAVFMIVAGLIYTIERCVAMISNALVVSGYASNGTGTNMKPVYPGFFDNFFVWFFFFIGFIILAFGFPRKHV